MKTIEKIDVKVSYNVILENLEVPDDIYEQIMEVYSNSKTLSPNYRDIKGFELAFDYIQSQVSDDMCHHYELEIDDLETEEE